MKSLAFAYGFFLPFTSVLAISGWLNIPAIVGILVLLQVLLSRRQPLTSGDWLTFLCFVGPAVVSSLLNVAHLGEEKFLNHLATYFFVFLVFYLAPRALLMQADGALWKGVLSGVCFALAFEALEFTLGVTGHAALLEIIPRSAVSGYDATYGGFVLRARSLAEESGHFALYLGGIGALALAYMRRSNVSRSYQHGLAAAIGAGILLTFSTSGLVFALLCIVIIVFVYAEPMSKKLRLLAIVLSTCLLVYVSAAGMFGLDLLTVVTNKLDDLNGRAPRFLESLEYFQRASLLEVAFGLGPGYYNYRGLSSVVTLYGLTTFQTGVIGLLTLLFLLFYYLRSSSRLDPSIQPFYQFSLLFMICVYGGMSNYWYPWLWFLFAAINAERARRRNVIVEHE